MRNKFLLAAFTVSLFFGATGALHAVGGCNDSPEAPTEILMMVGAAGMFYGSSVLSKLVRKRRGR